MISLIRWELTCADFFLTPGSLYYICLHSMQDSCSFIRVALILWSSAFVFSYCIRALCSDHHCNINYMYFTYLLDSPRQWAFGYRGHSTTHRAMPGTQKIPIHFYWFASQILLGSRQSKTQIVASSKISERVSVSLDIGIEYFTIIPGKDKFYAIFINNTKNVSTNLFSQQNVLKISYG